MQSAALYCFRTFGAYTLDVIAGTGFGFETNTLEDEHSKFLNCAKTVFMGSGFSVVAFILGKVSTSWLLSPWEQ